jgi:hypothetical protein
MLQQESTAGVTASFAWEAAGGRDAWLNGRAAACLSHTPGAARQLGGNHARVHSWRRTANTLTLNSHAHTHGSREQVSPVASSAVGAAGGAKRLHEHERLPPPPIPPNPSTSSRAVVGGKHASPTKPYAQPAKRANVPPQWGTTRLRLRPELPARGPSLGRQIYS